MPDFLTASAKTGVLSLSEDRKAQFSLMRTGSKTDEVEIEFHLRRFIQQTTATELSPEVRSSALTKSSRKGWEGFLLATNNQTFIDLELVLNGATGTNIFEGTLFLREKGASWTNYPLQLRPSGGSKSRALNFDTNVVNCQVTLPFIKPRWPFVSPTGASNEHFSVRLTGGSWPADPNKLAVRLEPAEKKAGSDFDLQRWIEWRYNGQAVSNFTTRTFSAPPLASTPEITMLAQGTLQGTFQGIPPGEYEVVVRFQTMEPEPRESAPLRLRLQVRHHWSVAAVVLLFSVAASWMVTKFLEKQRKLIKLRRRIDELEKQARFGDPSLPGTVRARALLSQAEALTQTLWLTGEEEIKSRLEQATHLLEHLSKANDLLDEIAHAHLPPFIEVRMRVKVRTLCAKLEVLKDDQNRLATLKELDDLRLWLLDDGILVKAYHADLTKDVENLISKYQLDSPAPPPLLRDHPAILTLRQAAKTKPTHNRDELVKCEEQYARLKVLCERCENPEFSKLLGHTGLIQEFFKLSDDAAWERLKGQKDAGKILIRIDAQDIEKFELFKLRFDTRESDLNGTFLVQHGIAYEWTWTVASSGETRQRTEYTNAPNLVQYSPIKGKLKAKLLLCWGSELIVVESETSAVKDSSVFGWLVRSEQLEWISLVAAALVAVATGLTTNYVNAPTFGSFRDYLALVVLGVGVDLAKSTLLARPS